MAGLPAGFSMLFFPGLIGNIGPTLNRLPEYGFGRKR